MNSANGNGDVPVRTIKCMHCGHGFRVHEPIVVNSGNAAYSQLLVVPGWSLDERACPQCKTQHMPVITKAEFSWVSANREDSQRRIIPAGAAMPMSLEQVAKIQESVKKG